MWWPGLLTLHGPAQGSLAEETDTRASGPMRGTKAGWLKIQCLGGPEAALATQGV